MFSSSTHRAVLIVWQRTRTQQGEIIKIKEKRLNKKKKTFVTLYYGRGAHIFCEFLIQMAPVRNNYKFCWSVFCFCFLSFTGGSFVFSARQIALYDRKSVIQRAIYGQLGTFTFESTTRTFVGVCFLIFGYGWDGYCAYNARRYAFFFFFGFLYGFAG